MNYQQSLPLVLPPSTTRSPADTQFLQQIQSVVTSHAQYGTTTSYPTTNLFVGRNFFDTTLNTTVIWNGTAWISAADATTTISPIHGGTGLSAYATGDTLYASAANTLSKLTIGTTGQLLNVSGGVPVWSSPSSLGIGTVTSVSVTTANGISGTVTNPTTTPAISLAIATQPIYDQSTNAATTQFVYNAVSHSMSTIPLNLGATAGGTYSFATQGTGCTVVYSSSGGAITSISLGSIGSGYKIGDLISVQGATGNQDAYLRVATLGSGGIGVGSLTILYGGTGYTGAAYSTTTAAPDIMYPYTFTLSGTLTSNATFIVQNGALALASNQWIINNNTTGSFTLKWYVSNGSNAITGSGVLIPQGTNSSASAMIQTDGQTDVWYASNVAGAFQATSLTTGGYTVATLPSGVIGMRAYVNNALAPVFLATVVGGGAVVCPVFYNGTNWVCG